MESKMFVSANEFSVYIEKRQKEKKFDSIIETLIDFYESETDLEMNQIAKLLNKTILKKIENEANVLNLINTESKGLSIDDFL